MQNPLKMAQDKIEMPTLHTNLSQIIHGWSKMLGHSKLGVFLYDLQQKEVGKEGGKLFATFQKWDKKK